MRPIPDGFLEYVFRERRRAIEKVLFGGIKREEFFLEFTRHTPAIISYGPAGVNGAIKGIGFVHKEEYLENTINKLRRFSAKDTKEALQFLLKWVYVEDKIDFTKLATLEIAKKHSWMNFSQNPEASILFYTPPSKSYEVRAEVEIHKEGLHCEFVNLVHDVYHLVGKGKGRDRKNLPAYVFLIREIYNNSPEKMGIKIYEQTIKPL